ncbi:MAG: hypothetical protein LKF98_02760 [Microbacteriaceae bacterium]|jgi:polyferredoxin|nr:hypothetical protein [Microbacteriaceae bacterium]
MPWWSWILIWAGLGLALLAVLAGFLWWYWTLVRGILGSALPLFPLLERLTAQLSGLAEHRPIPDTTMAPSELQRLRAVWRARLVRQQRRRARTPKRLNLARRGEHARRHAVASPGPRRAPLRHP